MPHSLGRPYRIRRRVPLLGSVDGLVDGVGDGDGGAEMSVGVGTGGSVSGGSGEIDRAGSPLCGKVAGRVVTGTTAVADAPDAEEGRAGRAA
jgi:hypothetical protein